MSSNSVKEKLLQTLQERPDLYAQCHIPLNINIVIHLFSILGHKLPSTHTALYTALVCSELIRHKSLRMPDGNDLEEINDISSLPESMSGNFKAMCKLAYNGLLAHQSSFDTKAMKKCGIVFLSDSVPDTLSLMMAHKQITVFGMRQRYSFLHYTMQEYLAARHIIQLGYKQQKETVQRLLDTSPLTRALPFYAGLCKLEDENVLDLLLKVTRKPLDMQTVGKQLVEHVNDPGSDYRRLFLALVNCIYESQNHSLFKRINLPVLKGSSSVEIGLDFLHLTPTDCLSIGYYLKHAANTSRIILLGLGYCNIRDIGFKLLVQHIVKEKSIVSTVSIYTTSITHRGLESLRRGLGSIYRLCIDDCGLGGVLGLKYLIEGISRTTDLKALELRDCGITAEHKYLLLLLMLVSKSLLTLRLDYNNISGAIPVLSATLSCPTLEDLCLSGCSLNDEDLNQLGVSLCHYNSKLVCLSVSDNNFSSDAFTNFLRMLCNCKSELQLINYDKELTAAQQKVVDEINWLRTFNFKPHLVVGPHNVVTGVRSMAEDYVKKMQSLPKDFVTGND